MADEYVWIYGEKFYRWPTDPERKWPTWPDIIAGCDQILHYSRDLIGYAREYIQEPKESGKFPVHNLLQVQDRNASFDSEIGSDPWANWSPWQYREAAPGDPPLSEGTCTWDPDEGHVSAGSVRIAGVTQGCVRQHIRVGPGERYAIQAYCRIQGDGLPYVRIIWTDSDGLHLGPLDRYIFCSETEDDWCELFGVVEVPEGTVTMSIQLSINFQTAAEDIVWYDDVELCLLP